MRTTSLLRIAHTCVRVTGPESGCAWALVCEMIVGHAASRLLRILLHCDVIRLVLDLLPLLLDLAANTSGKGFLNIRELVELSSHSSVPLFLYKLGQ